jgi:hypothetical protein
VTDSSRTEGSSTLPIRLGVTAHLAAVMATLACANIEAPPGGPPDQAPPILLRTVPESLGVFPGFDDRVEFVFNEVVAEGQAPNLGLGSGTLEKLIVVSPSEGVPKVSWRHSRVTVKPREGWQPNRVYRVELLPGITDVERNRSNASTVITFATGGDLPTDTLSGTVIDWVAGRPLTNGLVLATLMPDSLTYRAFTDSAGRFTIEPLPRGDYQVYGVVDQNNDRQLDGRESFDSLTIARGTSDIGSLWAIPHDTVGPRVASIAIRDSLTVAITFTQYLDPYQRVDNAAVQVMLLPDSLPVPTVSLLPQEEHDSLYPRIVPTDTTLAADSTAATDSLPRADSAQAETLELGEPVPEPGKGIAAGDPAMLSLLGERPKLFDRLVLRFAEPMIPDGRYFVTTTGIRNVNGIEGEGGGVGFVAPVPPPPPEPVPDDSLPPAPQDTVGIAPDSLAQPDSSEVANP